MLPPLPLSLTRSSGILPGFDLAIDNIIQELFDLRGSGQLRQGGLLVVELVARVGVLEDEARPGPRLQAQDTRHVRVLGHVGYGEVQEVDVFLGEGAHLLAEGLFGFFRGCEEVEDGFLGL